MTDKKTTLYVFNKEESMYHIVICDDDKSYISYLKRLIIECGVEAEEIMFYEYTSGEELIESLEETKKVDLLIQDMQMKEYDGNRTAKLFRKEHPSSVIVFCSGVCQPTVESFETTPFRYLLKEYSKERMIKELVPVINEMKSKQTEPVVIGTYRYDDVKLRPDDILYISIVRNGSEIHTVPEQADVGKGRPLTSRKKIDELYEELKDYGFEYAHNSYIVNLNHIKRKNTKELELKDGTVLTIARSKEKQLRQAFAKYKSHKY